MQSALGWPIKKTPSYSTVTQTPASRRGQVRVSLAPNPIWKFDLDLTMIRGDLNQTTPTAIQALLDFYGRMLGSGDDWLYLDPYDNSANSQLIGYGDGSTTQFQIGRSLNGLGFEMMQNVFPSLVTVGGTSVPAGPQASGNYWYSGLENLLLESQSLGVSPWLLSNFTDIANNIVAPDGTTTADKLTATGNATLSQSFALQPSGTQLTFSIWAKVPSGTLVTDIVIGMFPAGNVVAIQAVTLTTTWQRFSVTGILPYGITGNFVQLGIGATIPSGSVIHSWGAQVERSPTPTPSSYVATTTAVPVTPRGILTFATAPANGAAIAVTFNYYYRCHFVDDEWADLNEFLYQYWELPSLKFESLIL